MQLRAFARLSWKGILILIEFLRVFAPLRCNPAQQELFNPDFPYAPFRLKTEDFAAGVAKLRTSNEGIFSNQEPTLIEKLKQEEDDLHHPLCSTMEQNITTLSSLRHREANQRNLQDKIADTITAVSGDMVFVYVHIVCFATWILINIPFPGHKPIDPFPFNFLTMVVSLEAIFLSTFVLISQNRMAAQADRRAELDLHIGLLTEHEITRIITMLDAIQDKLGIENEGDTELKELERQIRPQDVLAMIERTEERMRQMGGK